MKQLKVTLYIDDNTPEGIEPYQVDETIKGLSDLEYVNTVVIESETDVKVVEW